MSPDGRRPPLPDPEWAGWPDERLLDLRLCDLDLTIRDGELADRIDQLYGELRALGLRFRPHFWLSDEWYCPDGVPGVAIPFYLAHPRLGRLELSHMLEVEGGTPEWCMRLLRHETGHAIENAYRLRLRRRRQKLFGKSSERYRDYYVPRPYSRRFVVHLEQWYAQSHPDEDFAETFAVWLAPDSNWRERYAGWPVLRKLEYVDTLMREIADQRPPVVSRARVDPSRGSGRRSGSTTRRSAATTGSTRTSPTTATSAASSRTRPSSGTAHRRRSSWAGSAGRCAAAWPRGRACTSTRSTRCSAT